VGLISQDLDAAMSGPVRLDCIGGFVVTQLYGLDRATIDVDVIKLAPQEAADTLMTLALRVARLPGNTSSTLTGSE